MFFNVCYRMVHILLLITKTVNLNEYKVRNRIVLHLANNILPQYKHVMHNISKATIHFDKKSLTYETIEIQYSKAKLNRPLVRAPEI